ncbi:MAG: nucleotide exchange factor GrpE [Planctomycetes bacterium]|nr:nucleotide exchange factor GrpE [Planctomycetota bacterium]
MSKHDRTEDPQREPDERQGAFEDEHAKLSAERDEYLASWQRAQADYQNLRRRIGSDTEAAVGRAKQTLLGELLLVLDYLEMALAAPCTSSEGKNLHAGVEMTRQQLWQVLEREGVALVPLEGRFDPAVHQAVESSVDSDEPAGTLLATLRRGYRMGGQILRPAHVRVAVDGSASAAEAN